MIVNQQTNIAGFAGNHRQRWPGLLATRISKTFSGAALLNLRIKFGSTVLLYSGAVAAPTGGVDVPWEIDGEFVVRSIGASGQVSITGDTDNGQTSGLLAHSGTVTIDTTAAADIAVSAQWGVASASNSITAQVLNIEKSEV